MTVAEKLPAEVAPSAEPRAPFGVPEKVRPALAALPKIKGRRRGLMLSVVVLLVAALAGMLGINIYMANTQYALVQMNAERAALIQENQTLTEQVQLAGSPQMLADAAVGYGMVMPGTAGTLSLEEGTVGGAATEAEADERPSSFVPSPTLQGEPAPLVSDVSEQISGAPQGLLGAGALHVLGEEFAPTQDHNRQESGNSEGLNGGTIPAPTLSR